MADLSIAEGISGTWFYHLSLDGGHISLCGLKVMPTSVPVKAWGTVTHLHERYCKACEARGK